MAAILEYTFKIQVVATLATICCFFMGKYLKAKKAEELFSALGWTPDGTDDRRVIGRSRAFDRIRRRMPTVPSRWIPAAAILATLPFLLKGNPFPTLLLPIGIAAARRVKGKRSEKKRVLRLEEQVSDLLDSLSQSLRAGLSLAQALELSLQDVGDEMKEEIYPCVMAIMMGESPQTSLKRLGDVTVSPSLRLLCKTLVLLHTKGADIPRIMDRLREKVAESRDTRREFEVMTAQSRASGYLVSALPGIFLFLQASINFRSVSQLLFTPVGNLLGALALAMNLAGFLAVRKIVELE